jgi:phosphoribosyl-ATP pyrophosphohydrolase/phosphoribosyl-AMP cyclohydrolase
VEQSSASAGEQSELFPVVVQDVDTKRVLMLAWMNDTALDRTHATGEAWFWSRSRGRLWRKGDSSGNVLAVEEIRDDCDGDALLLSVRPAGPTCHTGARSCFAPWLWRRIAQRALERPASSYVVSLIDDLETAAGKVAEEGMEVADAARESDERLVAELADLWFHSYVLLAARGLDPDDVEAELARRAGD